MRKRKLQRCYSCGCQRACLVKSQVLIQLSPKYKLGTKWACVPCFLDFLLLKGETKGTYNYKKAMMCVEDAP